MAAVQLQFIVVAVQLLCSSSVGAVQLQWLPVDTKNPARGWAFEAMR